MAEFVSRGEPSVRLIKLISFTISLMFLVNTVNALDFMNNLERYKEYFQAILEQAVGHQKQQQNRIENISRLLREANSLSNEEELETFIENLEEAVNAPYKQKINDKSRIAAAAEQFNMKMEDLYPLLLQIKMQPIKSQGDNQLIRAVEQIFGTGRTYLTLKKKVFAAESKDMRERLKEVIDVLKELQQVQHNEL